MGFTLELTSPERGTSVLVYILGAYGKTGDAQDAEELLQDVEEWVVRLPPHVPVFVVGDSNLEWCDTLQRWADSCGLLGLDGLHGAPPRPSVVRKIDHVWGNRNAAVAVRSLRWDSLYATHPTAILELDLVAYGQLAWRRETSPPLPLTQRRGWVDKIAGKWTHEVRRCRAARDAECTAAYAEVRRAANPVPHIDKIQDILLERGELLCESGDS